eukprot:scaffold2973_cov325-Prasinococcus_capsulatus_cf.AAC.2
MAGGSACSGIARACAAAAQVSTGRCGSEGWLPTCGHAVPSVMATGAAAPTAQTPRWPRKYTISTWKDGHLVTWCARGLEITTMDGEEAGAARTWGARRRGPRDGT